MKAQALIGKINSLLGKGAIEELDSNIGPGFYNNLILVQKKTGGFRPILNLKPLNQFLKYMYHHFKMENLKSIILSQRKGDWGASLDLSDAYLHVPIHKDSRKFLRFAVQNRVFQFIALPFGITSGPTIFAKVI